MVGIVKCSPELFRDGIRECVEFADYVGIVNVIAVEEGADAEDDTKEQRRSTAIQAVLVGNGAHHAEARETEYGCLWNSPLARFNVLDCRCCCMRDWMGRRTLEGSCREALGQTSDTLCPVPNHSLDAPVPMRLNMLDLCEMETTRFTKVQRVSLLLIVQWAGYYCNGLTGTLHRADRASTNDINDSPIGPVSPDYLNILSPLCHCNRR